MRRSNCLHLCAILALVHVLSSPVLGMTLYVTSSSAKGDIIALDTVTGEKELYFDHSLFRKANGQFGQAREIDGFHIVNSTTFLLSTSQAANLGQPLTSFSDSDIVLYDKTTDTAQVLYSETSLFWAYSGPQKQWQPTTAENIDALCAMADGSYLLSTKDKAVAGGNHLGVQPGDIFRFDPVSNTASIYLRGADIFTDEEGRPSDTDNIDGLSCDESTGLIYFSISGSTYIRSGDDIVGVSKGDVVAHDTATGQSTIFLSLDDLVNKWSGMENMEGLKIVGISAPLSQPAMMPEPLTLAAMSLGLAGIGGYIRRRVRAA